MSNNIAGTEEANRDRVIVRIGDIDYVGWETMSVTRSMEQASSGFSMTVSDPDFLMDITTVNGEIRRSFRMTAGTTVEILYGSDLLMTGYLDTISVDYDDKSHNIRFDGRSKTKDLVDCSAQQLGQITNQTITQIARTLAAPYGINVKTVNFDDKEPIKDFQVNVGETVFEAIQRLADIGKVSISFSAAGELLLTRGGHNKSGNSLAQRDGFSCAILKCSFTASEDERYSKIIVLSQEKGSDDKFGKHSAQIEGVAEDKEMRRSRVKIIRADTGMTAEEANAKAHYELQGRAAKGTEIQYTVQGWRGTGNQLWRENELVEVSDPMCRIDGAPLLITTVTYRMDNTGGTSCDLTLNPPTAFEYDHHDEDATDYGKNSKHAKTSKLKKHVGKSTTDYWKPSDPI